MCNTETTLKELKYQLKKLQTESDIFYQKEIIVPVRNLNKTLLDTYKVKLEEFRTQIYELKKNIELFEKENERKKREKYPKELHNWLKVYESGVNFGNKGLNIKYVDPKNYFVILTNPGSIGGMGTAMGTGGYYYSNTTHFVAFPQFGRYLDKVPFKNDYLFTNHFFDFEGKLTKIQLSEMIKEAMEFVKIYDIKPFEFDKIQKRNF